MLSLSIPHPFRALIRACALNLIALSIISLSPAPLAALAESAPAPEPTPAAAPPASSPTAPPPPAPAHVTATALSPAPASLPPKGQKPDSSIEIAGPDNGGEAQLYKLPGGARVVICVIRLSNKVVTAKSYFAKDGSGWIALEEKAYFYDQKKQTLSMDKFGDINTANLTFDTEKRVTTASIAGDSLTPKKPAPTPDAETIKSLEQQLTDAATEARQFTANTLLPYMEAHKSGTLTLED